MPPVALILTAMGSETEGERVWIGFANTLETSRHSVSDGLNAIALGTWMKWRQRHSGHLGKERGKLRSETLKLAIESSLVPFCAQ